MNFSFIGFVNEFISYSPKQYFGNTEPNNAKTENKGQDI